MLDVRTRLTIHLMADLAITDGLRRDPGQIWDRAEPAERDHWLARADAILAIVHDTPTAPGPYALRVEVDGQPHILGPALTYLPAARRAAADPRRDYAHLPAVVVCRASDGTWRPVDGES